VRRHRLTRQVDAMSYLASAVAASSDVVICRRTFADFAPDEDDCWQLVARPRGFTDSVLLLDLDFTNGFGDEASSLGPPSKDCTIQDWESASTTMSAWSDRLDADSDSDLASTPECTRNESMALPHGSWCAAAQPCFKSVARSSPTEMRTTVVMKNVPQSFTRVDLLQLFNEMQFEGLYTFMHLPVKFKTGQCVGFAIVDFVDSSTASQFWRVFSGFKAWTSNHETPCELDWSHRQGLQQLIAQHRNSRLMHHSVPDEHRPMLFSRGRRIEFPAPITCLKPPRKQDGYKW